MFPGRIYENDGKSKYAVKDREKLYQCPRYLDFEG
jgi:hypothetical protein